MAKHGVLFERDPFIEKCINRAGIFTEELDGGAPVVIDKVNAKEKELYDVKKYTSSADGQVAVVYNPSVKYDNINGKLFPARSLDDRDYTNPAKVPFDFFIPEKNVGFGINQWNLNSGNRSGLVVGDVLKPEASTGLWVKTSTSSGKKPDGTEPAFIIEDIAEVKYPTGDFTEDKEKVYYVRTLQN